MGGGHPSLPNPFVILLHAAGQTHLLQDGHLQSHLGKGSKEWPDQSNDWKAQAHTRPTPPISQPFNLPIWLNRQEMEGKYQDFLQNYTDKVQGAKKEKNHCIFFVQGGRES